MDAQSNHTYKTDRKNLNRTAQQYLLTINVANTNKHIRKLTLTIIQILLFGI